MVGALLLMCLPCTDVPKTGIALLKYAVGSCYYCLSGERLDSCNLGQLTSPLLVCTDYVLWVVLILDLKGWVLERLGFHV